MPNHRENAAPSEREWDEETLERISDYTVRVAEEAARQRKQTADRGK